MAVPLPGVLLPSFSLDQYVDLKPVVVPHISSNWHGFYVSGIVNQAGTGIHSASVTTDI